MLGEIAGASQTRRGRLTNCYRSTEIRVPCRFLRLLLLAVARSSLLCWTSCLLCLIDAAIMTSSLLGHYSC